MFWTTSIEKYVWKKDGSRVFPESTSNKLYEIEKIVLRVQLKRNQPHKFLAEFCNGQKFKVFKKHIDDNVVHCPFVDCNII